MQDFVWWSGLTVSDAKAGLAMAQPQIVQEVIGGQSYWLAASIPNAKAASPTAYLLPAYDEYTVAYTDRSAVLSPSHAKQSGNGIFSPTLVVDGQVAGTWKRTLKPDAVVIAPSFFAKLNQAEIRGCAVAATRYRKFLGASAVLLESSTRQ